MVLAVIDGARRQIQIDTGFGNAVTPGPDDVEYPVMRSEFTAPKLRVYPRYTVVAEKFEAPSTLGIANSRMKDYFDLWVLARQTDFDGDILRQAFEAAFERRTPPHRTAAFWTHRCVCTRCAEADAVAGAQPWAATPAPRVRPR
jgi:hypothetical protein